MFLQQHPIGRLLCLCLVNGAFWAALYLAIFAIYHNLRIHEKFGIFGVQEPETHYRAALKNWKIPFLWGIGTALIFAVYGFKSTPTSVGMRPELSFAFPADWVLVHSPNVLTDILFAIVSFYLIDLADYWAHRIGHHSTFMYKKFPFAHFVHHNWSFINPMVVTSSPFLHPATISGCTVYLLVLSQGLVKPLLLAHMVKMFSNFASHLGCDPFPWLTKLNHKVGGWIPWIPLYHQYHHLHFTKQGNFGNLTCLWDYVFGTVIPESVHHIEQGEPTPEIAARMNKSPERMEAESSRYLKGRMGLNLS